MSTYEEALERAGELRELRARCPHGGDESSRQPQPGMCEACALQLLRENAQLKQVMRDLSEERGLAQALKPTLEPLLKLVRQHREQVKAVNYRLAYGGRITADEERRLLMEALPRLLGSAERTLRDVLGLAGVELGPGDVLETGRAAWQRLRETRAQDVWRTLRGPEVVNSPTPRAPMLPLDFAEIERRLVGQQATVELDDAGNLISLRLDDSEP